MSQRSPAQDDKPFDDKPFDGVDFTLMLMTAIVSPHWPFFVLLFVQTVVRRSPRAVAYILDTVGWQPEDAPGGLLPGAAKLLAAPDLQPQPLASDLVLEGTNPASIMLARPDLLQASLAKLPRMVELRRMRLPASSTSIPLGVDPAQRPIWIDLLTDAYHIGLYGQTGAGKDTLLRCWFILLARRNPPEAVKFAVLDGKGDWLVPQLAGLSHMFIVPAGGYGKRGDAAILAAIQQIDAEAERRQLLIRQAGCTNRDSYIKRTGAALPLLLIVATDVMTSVAGDVEGLLIALVSKARGLGIRVIVSMQTPTGRDTRWRGNLSTVLAGALQSGSQDEPALGLPSRELHYRPSQLPPPQQRPGVFICRVGGEQLLVQAPYLSDDDFDQLCTLLPLHPIPPTGEEDDDLFAGLLAGIASNDISQDDNAGNVSVTAAECDVTGMNIVTVTPAEAVKIATLLASLPPSEVTKRLDGYTPRRYSERVPGEG
ncbi:MAG: hypothetical protein HGA19_05570 [Oscillochloris sp.]|nr:hypothetical protein [Oscillochloris sp.]